MVGEPGPKVFSFQCASCGASIPVHVPGQSLAFVCPSCSTLVHESSTGVRLLQTAQGDYYKSLFKLGEKIVFRGEKWQILGFLVRSDFEEAYFWREYILFNPKCGYRFLTEADGHWNFLALTRFKPRSGALSDVLRWGNRSYRCFYRGRSKVHFVLGEFYWRVKVGDVASVVDFISPPDILSSEKSGDEIVWSAGTYIPRDDIQKAFQTVLAGRLPNAKGIAPNQVSPYDRQTEIWLHWLLFSFTLLLIQIFAFGAKDKTLLAQTLTREPGQNAHLLSTDSFVMEGDRPDLELELYMPLTNAWVDVHGTVVPEANQAPAFEFRRDFSYFSGQDDEGSWTEASNSHTLHFPNMAAGRYHVNVLMERDPSVSATTQGANDRSELLITVKTDTPFYWPFWTAFALLTAYPLARLWLRQNFEIKRNLGSDLNGSGA
jgi:hypothetical protein